MSTALATPNLFQLSGHGIHITYSTTGMAGKPGLTYQDAHGSHSFTGAQITSTETPIGSLVTVTLQMTTDRGSTTFSILVPRIKVAGPNQSVPIRTEAITTVHKFSIAPAFDHGQTELYTVHALHGMATAAVF